jgi:hypothetical protein
MRRMITTTDAETIIRATAKTPANIMSSRCQTALEIMGRSTWWVSCALHSDQNGMRVPPRVKRFNVKTGDGRHWHIEVMVLNGAANHSGSNYVSLAVEGGDGVALTDICYNE